MELINHLKKLYTTELKAELKTLEVQRKKVLGIHAITGITLIAGIPLFIYSFQGNHTHYIQTIFGAFLVVFSLVYHLKNSKHPKQYKTQYKHKIISKIINLIDPTWTYNHLAHVKESQYRKSKIFKDKHDSFKGDDLVCGKIDKTDFCFSELQTQYTEEYQTKEGTKTRTITIFNGLFVHIDFNKHIKKNTFVLPDFSERYFGKWGKKFQSDTSHGKIVNLENPEFEKYFVVHSKDPIEARYILTPAMMEAIVTIRKKYDTKLYISFVDSRVYIAIGFYKPLFEPNILKRGNSYKNIEEVFNYLNLISVIIKEMNLNTRIWTKK